MSLKHPWIGLRARFMLLAVLLTATSSAIWGGWLWQHEKQSLLDRASREGELLVATMAIPIINAIVYEELGIIHEGGLLDSFVAEIMATPQMDVRYAFVLNEEGRVLAHNRLMEYRKIYSDPLTLQMLRTPSLQQFSSVVDAERLSDFVMPLAIAGKSWGVLRVGISMEPAYKELSRLARQVVFFVILFSIGALLIYWLIGTWLARPVQALTRDMENYGDRLEALPVYNYRRDEIGLLQKSFQRMLEHLKTSEAERKASVARMLENERITAIGRIVSGVAHEVNNPLAGIEGALYQIEQKGGEPVRRYVGLVRQSIERIERIVSQLSDLSRAGAIFLKPVNSDRLFEDLAIFSRMATKGCSCEFTAENRCPPTTLTIDRDKIHQVILNLVLNAFDVACAEPSDSDAEVKLIARWQEGFYSLSVENTGPPIPDEVSEQIFTPFFTTKEPGKGTGMGLAISKGIAENHGGTLSHQRSGDYTVFTLTIPGTKGADSN